MEHFYLDERGRIHLGYFSRQSDGRFTVDFPPDDPAGLVIDAVAGGPNGTRASSKYGNFTFGQDADNVGVAEFGLADVNGRRMGFDTPYQVNVPLIWLPTGSMGNNGALTSGTANPMQYTKSYVYLPAGAIATSIPAAAAWYYCEWSSTTAGIVYNNVWDGNSEPLVPATKVAFVTTGPGAFTGATAETALFTLPFNALTGRARLDIETQFAQTNNAGAKTAKIRMNTIAGTTLESASLASNAHGETNLVIKQFNTNEQIYFSDLQLAAAYTRGAPAMGTETTNAAWKLCWTMTRAAATDVIVVESVQIVKRR